MLRASLKRHTTEGRYSSEGVRFERAMNAGYFFTHQDDLLIGFSKLRSLLSVLAFSDVLRTIPLGGV